jgi:hypothetical protein
MKTLNLESIIFALLITTIAVSGVSAQSSKRLKGVERKEFAKKMGNYRFMILGRDSILNLRPVNDSIKVSFRLNGVKVVVSYSSFMELVDYELQDYKELDKYLPSLPPLKILGALAAFLHSPTKGLRELELPDSVDETAANVRARLLEVFIDKGELEIFSKEGIKQEYIILRQYYCGKYKGCRQCMQAGILYFLKGDRMFFLQSMRVIS